MRRSTYQSFSIFCCLFFLQAAAWVQSAGWSVNAPDYANNMSMTAQVVMDGTEDNASGNWLAAFVGSEIRGVQQAQAIAGKAYYFLNIYSNESSGETASFRFYNETTNSVHTATEEVPFFKSDEIGLFPDGFEINVTNDGDFPISLLQFTPDTTFLGYPFEGVDLEGLLVSPDNDLVTWTHMNSSLISATIDANNVLTVTPDNPYWFGTSKIEVTATEVGTSNGYSATADLYFTVEPLYGPPVFGNPPVQFIESNLPPPTGDLGEFMDFDGPCLEYSFCLSLPSGDNGPPTWEQPVGNSGSMTVVTEVSFGGKPFTDMDNVLAGYVDGVLAGVASPQLEQGKVLYFLSLSNMADGAVSFEFYHKDGFRKYNQTSNLVFYPSGSEGDVVNPIALDVAPIAIDLQPSGQWTSTVVNPTYAGQLMVEFYAADCDSPDRRDTLEMTYLFNQCEDQTLSLAIDGSACLRADSIASDIEWFLDGSPIGDGIFHSATDVGVYQYQGLTPTGCPNIKSCPLLVSDVAGFNSPVGNSPPLPTSWLPYPLCGANSFVDIETGGTCCPPENIIYVDSNTPFNNDGSSWDNAFSTLQAAMELASICPNVTEIWVAYGTYYPTGGDKRTAAFELRNGLALYGRSAGSESAISDRDMENNRSILSGDIGLTGDNSDNSFHVVFSDDKEVDETAVLNGFVISGGNADSLGIHEKGGGIYLEEASPSILHCTITDNAADFSGGGMYNNDNDAVVDSCLFTLNSSKLGGGVISTNGATTKYTFCNFIENSSVNYGGGMHNLNSDVDVKGCTFSGNNTQGGGGIANINSSPNITNCVFTTNEAQEGAGIFNLASSTPGIINCTFFANVPSANGGAIRNNTATSPVITNCILWGNTSEIVDSPAGTIVSDCIVEGGYPNGTNILDTDPMFVSPTDLRTTPCSPAIDAGDNAANSTLEDISGNNRIINNYGSAKIDLGAYEIQSDLTLPCTWTGSGDGSLWSDHANWNDLFAPQKCRDVLIPTANVVTVPDNYEALGQTLEMELGAELITDPTATIDIGN